MFQLCLVVYFGLFCVFTVDSQSILTSAYAKVAKWGAQQDKDVGEGRSNGQSLFTQRADVNLRSGQNLNKKPDIVYHYSMSSNTNKRVDSSTKSPGFQDRFNPPAIFTFNGDTDSKPSPHRHADHHEDENDGLKSIVYAKAASSKQVSYDSPISSYNPAPSGIPALQSSPQPGFKGPAFPPNNNDNSDDMNYDDSPDNDKSPLGDNDNGNGNGGYQYNPPAPPPSSAGMDNGGYQYNPPTSGPPLLGPISLTTSQPAQPPRRPPMLPITNHPKFPSYVYDNNGSDFSLDHPPTYHDHHNQDPHDHDDQQDDYPSFDDTFDHKAPDIQDVPDTHDIPTADGNGNGHGDDLPEYVDHDPTLGKFSLSYPMNYQYDDHHDHDHHVYHHPPPMTTTTTTTEPPEPEDEIRVNKGHYSYYYLGRKLYYIPLYFSVYFIIYITVLILKSIARHKVNFVHDLADVNKGRSLAGNNGIDNVDEIAHRTHAAITSFKRKYIAM